MSKGMLEAIKENPSWSRQSKEWLRVAAWSFCYVDEPVPTRDDVAKALVSAQDGAPVRHYQ